MYTYITYLCIFMLRCVQLRAGREVLVELGGRPAGAQCQDGQAPGHIFYPPPFSYRQVLYVAFPKNHA